MIKVALVRGKYLNNFEGQNYNFNKKEIELTGISSFFPIHHNFPFPIIKLPSLADLGNNRLLKFAANRILGDSQMLFGLEKLAEKFDIFHTADPHYYYSYQLARLRKKRLIKKLIVTSWETIPFNNERIKKKREIKRFVLKQADYFICYTSKAKECLIKEGVDKRKIEVVRLGVDLDKFKIRNLKFKNTSQNAKSINVLFAGRMVKEKGIDDLKKAIVNLPDVNLIVANSINYQEMPRVYNQADILIMPSKKTKTWEEQYGMVLVEAMASGLPIVAYDTGAISEVLGETGIMVKENDIVFLIRNLKKLISDKDLRTKIGRIERKRAKLEFDSIKTNKKITEIYKKI